MRATSRRAAAQLVLGVGSLLAAFPPWGIWPLVLVGPLALTLLAVEAPSGRRAFTRLYLAGLVFFGAGSWWLAETHPVNLLIVTLVESLWVGAYGLAAWRVLGPPGKGRSPLLLGVLWTAHEALRMFVPLSGYPWQLVGMATAASPLLVQVADLGGVLGVSFVMSTVSGGLLARLWRRRGLGVALVVLVAAGAYGRVRPGTLAEPEPGPLLASIQPGFPQELKDDPMLAEEHMRVCFELSRQAVATAPDVLVWPETMWRGGVLSGEADDTGRLLARLVAPALPAGASPPQMLVGAVRLVPTGRVDDAGREQLDLANSAFLYAGDGRPLGFYDKHVLVPGGEWVPWYEHLPAGLQDGLRELVEGLAGFWPDLRAGAGAEPMQLAGVTCGVTICYENAYGAYCRELVRRGARFLVNLSNEAWFGRSSEFDHMQLHSVLRAVETRRALFRSTNSGISCLVLPDGRLPGPGDRLVVDGRDRAVRGTFSARVPLHSGTTVYARWGDWIGWACTAAAALLLLLRRGPCVS